MKGFPQGIPLVAMPYIIENEMDAAKFLPDQAQEQMEGEAQPDAETGEARYGANVVSTWDTHRFGGMPKAQDGYSTSTFKDAFAKMPKTAVKITKPATEKEDLIGRGFDNDPVEERKWARDSEVGVYYRMYKEAEKSQNIHAMRAAAKKLADADVSGFAISQNSPQDKLDDMSKILIEDADALVKKYYKKPAPKVIPGSDQNRLQEDELKRKDAKDAYQKAFELKLKYEKEGDVNKELYYTNKLDTLVKLHPDYKLNNKLARESWGSKGSVIPQTGEIIPEKPAIYYNANESLEIEKQKKELLPANPVNYDDLSDEELLKLVNQ